METFGAPLIFTTPNLADNKQVLLLEVQGFKVHLDATKDVAEDLPKYRDMMCRLARDPVGQTVVFELIMRLFFLHVLGVRPECLHNRRKSSRKHTREWCTDGVAAASTFLGIFGPILAFRGEIEAQGRGSLHPHILVWLVCASLYTVVSLLHRQPETLQARLREWLRAVVSAVEGTSQSSVQALPRRFGEPQARVDLKPKFSAAEQKITRFDGLSELDELRAMGGDLTDNQRSFLEQSLDEDWKRPLLEPTAATDVKATSVYYRPINTFAVARQPGYRRLGRLQQPLVQKEGHDVSESTACPATLEALSADDWERLFGEDVLGLVSEALYHICGDSCFKYSGDSLKMICRHGFYYVIILETGDATEEHWRKRRRGKPLRNALFVVKATDHGMQGRILHFQEHPFEGPSNYGGVSAMRCNLDVQDLRRVLTEDRWMQADDLMPHIGDRPDWGYMNFYEWNGSSYERRLAEGASLEGEDPLIWPDTTWSQDEWRSIFLSLLEENASEAEDEDNDLLREAAAQFSDGINTGFYINSYTTKHCPTMEGVLEELRVGIQRLEDQRQEERQKIEVTEEANETEKLAAKGKSPFAETMRTLMRLSSSYRRCYWKSGSEQIFPMLFGHMTFASHRCWTVYVKKAIFLAMATWRALFAHTLIRNAIAEGGGEIVKFQYTDAKGQKAI